jgi:uncharacterized protein with HEPN domain
VGDDRERLQDVLEAIERIERHTSRGRSAFYEDERVQTWVVHHLMIIGEACRSLSPQFRVGHSDEVWAEAAGLRNVIVHHYFGIDLEIVWGVIERDPHSSGASVRSLLLVDLSRRHADSGRPPRIRQLQFDVKVTPVLCPSRGTLSMRPVLGNDPTGHHAE